MSWRTVELGKVCDFLSGFAFKSELFSPEPIGLPIIRIRDVLPGSSATFYGGDYQPQYIVEKGDILIGMDGEFNRERWKSDPALLNQRVCKAVARDSHLDEAYLYHALPLLLKKIEDETPFVTVKHLSVAKLKSAQIPLPPLEEQRRIAAILDKAAGLDNLSKTADRLAINLRVSRLRHLLSSEVSHLPKSKYAPLSDLIRDKPNNGIFRKNPEYQDPGSDGLPVVWVEQLFHGEVLDLSACKKLVATKAEIAKYGLMNGDILFCRSSLKREGIAKSNVYTGADGRALFECHLIRISPDPSKVNPIFLNECLNLPEIRAEARRLSKTSTMTTIDQDGILAISVPLPPLYIQEQFARDFALFQRLSARRRKSNHAIGLVAASLASLQLGET